MGLLNVFKANTLEFRGQIYFFEGLRKAFE